jgi:hypothetical protein
MRLVNELRHLRKGRRFVRLWLLSMAPSERQENQGRPYKASLTRRVWIWQRPVSRFRCLLPVACRLLASFHVC